jgi:hypothetical protein
MKEKIRSRAENNTVYGMGFIGALIYFLSTATNFVSGVVGIFKAVFWPAFLVYEALKVLSL